MWEPGGGRGRGGFREARPGIATGTLIHVFAGDSPPLPLTSSDYLEESRRTRNSGTGYSREHATIMPI